MSIPPTVRLLLSLLATGVLYAATRPPVPPSVAAGVSRVAAASPTEHARRGAPPLAERF
jgi:hypothetical protein